AGFAQHPPGVAPTDIAAAKLPDVLAGSQPDEIVGRRDTAEQIGDDNRNQISPDSHDLAPFQHRRLSARSICKQRTRGVYVRFVFGTNRRDLCRVGPSILPGVTRLGGLEGFALQRTPFFFTHLWRLCRQRWVKKKILGACGPRTPAKTPTA